MFLSTAAKGREVFTSCLLAELRGGVLPVVVWTAEALLLPANRVSEAGFLAIGPWFEETWYSDVLHLDCGVLRFDECLGVVVFRRAL